MSAPVTLENPVADRAQRAPVRPSATPSAVDRTVRTLALGTGLSGLLYCIAEVPEIITQRGCFPMWWIVLAVATIASSDAALVWSSRHGRRAIQRAALWAAMSYPALMLIAAPWMNYGTATGAGTWIWRLTVVGAVAAPLALSRPWLLGALPAWAAIETMVNRYAIGGWSVNALWEDYVRVVAAHAVFALFVSGALIAAATLDAAAQAARDHAAATAAVTAREQERARFAALVHDSVLSTLLDASRPGADPLVLRRQANGALSQLAALEAGDDRGPYGTEAAIGVLRAAVQQVDQQLACQEEALPGSEELRVPAAAVSALAAALAEAVRNSLRHAGPAAARTVTIQAGPDGVTAVIADDGRGFEPAAVAAGRLGITMSIDGRMAQLPGGAARVESAPGRGTRVTLSWTAGGQ